MVHVSTKYILYMIGKRLILNWPITCDDSKSANDTFGTSIEALKENTVRISEYNKKLEIEIVPDKILDCYIKSTLAAEIMFVNNIIFFVTISRHRKFQTIEKITDTKTSTLIHSVINMNRVYKRRQFHIFMLHFDVQLNTDHIWGAVMELHATFNTISWDDNVPEA